MAGLFFCLASADGTGLLFCPAAIHPNTSVYIVFYTIHASYTAHAAKQHTGLCRRFSSYLPCFAAAVWRVHPAIPRRLRHAGAYHSTAAPPARTRYQHYAGRCTAQHSRPIIIRYIRGTAVCPCYGSIPDSVAYHRPCQPGGSAPAACGSLASADTLPAVQTRRTC